jgi:hypothetical protein
VVLQWATDTPVAADYVVFLQLLDQQQHLVGQRDAQPRLPTSRWTTGELIQDTHGLFIEPGTPPGRHRLIVGLYDSATGQRLPATRDRQADKEAAGDFVELGEIEIIRPPVPLPPGAFKIQTPMKKVLLDLSLLGYDLYKLGQRSSPDMPLQPNDPVQLVAYWRRDQVEEKLKDRLSLRVVTNNGENTSVSMAYPLAGVDYPVEAWPQGEIVRAQYDFFLSDLGPGSYRLALVVESEISGQREEALTGPFQIEPAD